MSASIVLAVALILADPAPAPVPAADLQLTPPADDLSFDLLDSPAPAPVKDTTELDAKLATRRTMLTIHQGLGLTLLALTTGTMITGQLNYSDRFYGPSTGRWEHAHALFTLSTLLVFTGTGLVAAFAPSPIDTEHTGWDRVRFHEMGMIGATAGMLTEGILGFTTVHREGFANQGSLARAHLIIGYTTLAFMAEAVGALVF